ncbi:hypothetical protein M404DRAFT_22690 [Pisolithus tinctorius Marx 270]|uniref:Uncharacterized protein n=1 Tax=Pisolithus tinctorius Marx 270 TaxID=870435 RepID=A0A0C3PJU8_PISTI|nr:hypothetical protein M404DRAFT_22690 [Pisolithus tinctorius Marx 270]
MKVNSITEGMIASFAIMARYLLTHDTELNAEGNHTKIQYRDDFNFYVWLLFKCNKWSWEVMQFFNDDLFGPQPPRQPPQFEPTHLAPQPRNWEDDLLEEMDQDSDTPLSIPNSTGAESPLQSQAGSHPPDMAATVCPLPSASTSVLEDTTVNHQASASISHEGAGNARLSATTQVHLGVGRLSLTDPGDAESGCSVSSARRTSAASKRRITPVAADAPLITQPLQEKRCTRATNRGKK